MRSVGQHPRWNVRLSEIHIVTLNFKWRSGNGYSQQHLRMTN